MTFDNLACLRYLRHEDVSTNSIDTLIQIEPLIIIGIFGKIYICLSEKQTGSVLFVDSEPIKYEYFNKDSQQKNDLRDQVTFVNSSIQQFLTCLLEFKSFNIRVSKIDDFSSNEARNALNSFKEKIFSIDPGIFSHEISYWSLVIDDLDIW